MFYWFAYSTLTGAIPTGYAIISDATSNPWPGLGSGLSVVSFDEQTASAAVQGAYLNPSRYLVQSGVLTLQPYLTASYSSGTLTVTLQNPPATPPTSATLTVGSTTQTIALANNSGTLALAVHPSLAGYSLPAQVTATGCVAWSGDVGTPGQSAPVAIQVVTPTGGTTPTVAPCGPGSKAFDRAYRMGIPQDPAQAIMALVAALAGLNVAAAPVAHILVTKVIPALTASTYTPLVLTAQEQAALTTWANDFATVLTPLADTVDATGAPSVPLAEAIALAPGVAQSMQAYSEDVATIPGLE